MPTLNIFHTTGYMVVIFAGIFAAVIARGTGLKADQNTAPAGRARATGLLVLLERQQREFLVFDLRNDVERAVVERRSGPDAAGELPFETDRGPVRRIVFRSRVQRPEAVAADEHRFAAVRGGGVVPVADLKIPVSQA